MLRTHAASHFLGLALVASLATVSCGDDDDSSGAAAGTSGTGGESSDGGSAGSQAAGGTSSPSAGAPGEAGTTSGLGGAGGAVSTAVVLTELASGQPVAAAGAGGAGGAANAGPVLINAWGISFNPDPTADTKFWISAADSGVSFVYAADGTQEPLVVTIPAATAGTDPGSPTGQVYNPTTGFKGDKFIFATEDGLIVGWKTGTAAVVQADLSADGASYKGLALTAGKNPMLLAANFHAGTVDVFDKTYAAVAAPMFVDPKPIAGFAPFNVAVLGDMVYVAYAKQDADQADEVAGPGLGYVNSFNPDGSFGAHLITQKGALNAPWGLALAPAGFTPAPGALIVGNFGDGMIHGYDVTNGALTAELTATDGKPLAIDGLWGLTFGPKKTVGDLSQQLFFTAGPEEETRGLFGVLSAP
jgi:uncharacterized protein (TIGR03118 family)